MKDSVLAAAYSPTSAVVLERVDLESVVNSKLDVLDLEHGTHAALSDLLFAAGE